MHRTTVQILSLFPKALFKGAQQKLGEASGLEICQERSLQSWVHMRAAAKNNLVGGTW